MADIQAELIALRIVASFALAGVATTTRDPKQFLSEVQQKGIAAVDRYKILEADDGKVVREQAKGIISDMIDNIRL